MRERGKDRKERKERKKRKEKKRDIICLWDQFGFSVIEIVWLFACQSESQFNLIVYLF
jgi:hypothetical protein